MGLQRQKKKTKKNPILSVAYKRWKATSINKVSDNQGSLIDWGEFYRSGKKIMVLRIIDGAPKMLISSPFWRIRVDKSLPLNAHVSLQKRWYGIFCAKIFKILLWLFSR